LELAAGEPVVIDSSTLMCALLHAGLSGIDDYAFGSRHCGRQFLLDVDGTVSEWTEPEEIPIYQLHGDRAAFVARR
jgi:hypothetical protein